MRLARWRPVCPECGYSVRGLERPRCPECGDEFPSARRTFRRWAFQRLAWDQARRGSLPYAYLATVFPIVLCPWRVARGVALPDRWPRAVRWAGVHLLLAAIAGALLSNEQYFVRWFVHQFRPDPFQHPCLFLFKDAPTDRVGVWLIQSLLGWAIALIVLPMIGCLLSVGIPGRHRAAKLGGVKWSMYATIIPIAALAGWYGYFYLFPVTASAGPPLPVTFTYTIPPPLPVRLLAIVYAFWWAIGMAANPYNRIRGARALLLYALLYGGAWIVVTQVLFRPEALSALL